MSLSETRHTINSMSPTHTVSGRAWILFYCRKSPRKCIFISVDFRHQHDERNTIRTSKITKIREALSISTYLIICFCAKLLIQEMI